MSNSTVLETYAAKNSGFYPLDESDLTSAHPPYLSNTYNNNTFRGYKFYVTLNPDGYKIIAEPEECGVTGNKNFIMQTRGALTIEDCKK